MNYDEEYKRDFTNFGVFRCWECDFSLEYYGEIEWVKSYSLDKKITKEFDFSYCPRCGMKVEE